MNILFLVLMSISVVLIIRGYRRGLLKSAVSAIGIVLAVFLTMILYPYVARLICRYSSLDEEITGKVQKIIVEKCQIPEEERYQELSKTAQMETLEKLGLPDIINTTIIDNNNKEIYEKYNANTFIEYISKYIAVLIIKGIAYLATYMIMMLIVYIFIYLSDMATTIPVLNGINKGGGMIFGAVQALILIWIIYIVITTLSIFEVGAKLLKMVDNSRLLTWLYRNNIFLKFIVDIMERL